MTDVAIILLSVLALMLGGSVVYMIARTGSLTDELLKARDQSGANAIAAERAAFESKQLAADLASEKATCDSLEAYVADQAQVADDSSVLPADDVAGRVLRIARRQRAARLPAAPAGAGPAAAGDVHQPASAAGAGPDVPRPAV